MVVKAMNVFMYRCCNQIAIFLSNEIIEIVEIEKSGSDDWGAGRSGEDSGLEVGYVVAAARVSAVAPPNVATNNDMKVVPNFSMFYHAVDAHLAVWIVVSVRALGW